MSEPSSKEPKDESESNPPDLSDLQSFSFGTQWTDAGKKAQPGNRHGYGRESGRGRRPDRRPGGGGPPRDRRPSRKPFSEGGPRSGGGGHPPREGGRRFQDRGNRGGGDERGEWRRGKPMPDRPYQSEVFEVGFYPDDTGFSTIIKALRTNHITYELFHVAKIFLEKPDRYVASVTRKAAKGEKPERVFVSIPDGMPFQTEEEAIQHAVTHYADTFFETEEIEVDPPSGNFPFVNRCGITKTLLGPPNYHRYEEFVMQHHKTQLSNMAFEKFKASIEQVREEEAVNEWLESMKKTVRYTSKPAEGEEAQTFESLSHAIGFLRTSQKDKIIRVVNYARVSGVTLEKFANTEACRAVAGELERQRRFPLETANAIRGRLRREKFSIYKRGSKGVTLICATKRNFRKAGQVMSDSLNRLIQFLELNQNIKGKELPPKYEAWLKETYPDAVFDEKKLFQDLHWLVADGYVSHFGDDSLFAQPILSDEPKPAPKKKAAIADSQNVEQATAPAKVEAEASSETDETKAEAPKEDSTEAVAEDKVEDAPAEVVTETAEGDAEPAVVEAPSATEVESTADASEAVAADSTDDAASSESADVADSSESVTIEAKAEATAVEEPAAEEVPDADAKATEAETTVEAAEQETNSDSEESSVSEPEKEEILEVEAEPEAVEAVSSEEAKTEDSEPEIQSAEDESKEPEKAKSEA